MSTQLYAWYTGNVNLLALVGLERGGNDETKRRSELQPRKARPDAICIFRGNIHITSTDQNPIWYVGKREGRGYHEGR